MVANVFIIGVALAGAVGQPRLAETANGTVVPGATTGDVVPAGLSVEIEIEEDVSSKTATIDAMFPIRLRAPIMVDGRELVPAGTRGAGQVIHAAKARWGGKAGELVLAARYLDFGGQRIPLRRFTLVGVGRDNSGAALVAGAIVPFASFLVSGGDKLLPAGSYARALVASDTPIPASNKGE